MYGFDTGTMESLYEAGEFVRAVERSQDLPVCVPEEIAFENGWIGREELVAAADRHGKSAWAAPEARGRGQDCHEGGLGMADFQPKNIIVTGGCGFIGITSCTT